MTDINFVLLIGTIDNTPTTREMPGGAPWVNFDLGCHTEHGTETIPIVTELHVAPDLLGETVEIHGRVRRRYFRAGGVTQSRTEIVAHRIIRR
jgi:single-strand DNA-binding protein